MAKQKTNLRKIIRDAIALRAQHPGASAASRLHEARGNERNARTLSRIAFDDAGIARCKRDGFQIIVRCEPDDQPDLSHAGEFTDDPRGAIRRPNAGPREYRYIRPAITEREHYADLRSFKYGKTQAREMARAMVRDAVKLLEDQASGEMRVARIVARAYLGDIELGMGALHGIEVSGPRDAYLIECASECADEAIAEARVSVETIREKAKRALTKGGE